jgi:hypothetical protein
MKNHHLILSILLSFLLLTCTSKTSEKEDKDTGKKKDTEKEIVKEKSSKNDDSLIPDFKSTSNEAVLMRYKFKPDEKITYKFVTNIDINTSMGDIKMNIGMRGHYIIDTVYPDGSALAMFYIADIISKTSGMAEVTYDSRNPSDRDNYQYRDLNSMVEVDIPVLVTPTGELADINNNPHSKALAAASSFYDNQQLESLLQGSFTQLSEAPVKTGDVYDAGTLKSVATQQSIKFDVSYRIASVSGDKEKVIMVPVANIESDQGEIESDFTGKILFNIKEGNIDRSYATIQMKMTLEGQKVEFTIKVFYETGV